jgi:predicted HicB family RNase H-like nuclease
MKANNYLHYKDYIGSVEFSEEDGVFFGKVIGIKSLISYEGDSVATITQDFRDAIDEYLESCLEYGDEPEKSFKGSFNVRVSPELHRSLAHYSAAHGQTLNSAVEEAIRRFVNTEVS